MLLIILLACIPKQYSVIGVVDVKEPQACSVQLKDETIVYIDAKVCKGLKEGDTIAVVNNENR